MLRLQNRLQTLGAVGKTTGAGGGDIAWVICEDEEHQTQVAAKLSSEWNVYQLKITDVGVQAISNGLE